MKAAVGLLLVALGLRAPAPTRPRRLGDAALPHRAHGGGPVLADVELVSVTLGPDRSGHAAYTAWLAQSGWLTERTAEYGVRSVT